MLQLIDAYAVVCQNFYTADLPIYPQSRGIASALLGVVVQNDIERVPGIFFVRLSVC